MDPYRYKYQHDLKFDPARRAAQLTRSCTIDNQTNSRTRNDIIYQTLQFDMMRPVPVVENSLAMYWRPAAL
jgi:hypothetical protein